MSDEEDKESGDEMVIEKEKEEYDDDDDDHASPSEVELQMDAKRREEEEDEGKKKNAPSLKVAKVAGKKAPRAKGWTKNILPGRFHKSIVPILQLDNPMHYEGLIDPDTRVALSRCLDVLADEIAQACSSFAKPIPEDDAGYEPQMLSGVLAFNAVFSRIPAGVHQELANEAVQGILDLYCGIQPEAQ